MKKWMAIFVSVVMLAGLACPAAAAEEDPGALLRAAMEKTVRDGALDFSSYFSYDERYTEPRATTLMTEEFPVVWKIDAKAKTDKTGSFVFDADTVLLRGGYDEVAMGVYCDGANLYIDSAGDKIKTAGDFSGFKGIVESVLTAANAEAPEGLAFSYQLTRDVSGVAKIKFDADLEQVNSILGKVPQTASSRIYYHTVKGSAVINREGYMESITLNMGATLLEGSPVEITASMAIVINNPGQSITITPPDVSQYEPLKAVVLPFYPVAS